MLYTLIHSLYGPLLISLNVAKIGYEIDYVHCTSKFITHENYSFNSLSLENSAHIMNPYVYKVICTRNSDTMIIVIQNIVIILICKIYIHICEYLLLLQSYTVDLVKLLKQISLLCSVY